VGQVDRRIEDRPAGAERGARVFEQPRMRGHQRGVLYELIGLHGVREPVAVQRLRYLLPCLRMQRVGPRGGGDVDFGAHLDREVIVRLVQHHPADIVAEMIEPFRGLRRPRRGYDLAACDFLAWQFAGPQMQHMPGQVDGAGIAIGGPMGEPVTHLYIRAAARAEPSACAAGTWVK
jgi:hypothetical protein